MQKTILILKESVNVWLLQQSFFFREKKSSYFRRSISSPGNFKEIVQVSQHV